MTANKKDRILQAWESGQIYFLQLVDPRSFHAEHGVLLVLREVHDDPAPFRWLLCTICLMCLTPVKSRYNLKCAAGTLLRLQEGRTDRALPLKAGYPTAGERNAEIPPHRPG